MDLSTFLKIENHFEKSLFDSDDLKVSFYLDVLVLVTKGQFDEFYVKIQERIDAIETNQFEKGCCLIWKILVSETQYNRPARESALKRFHALADSNFNVFFEFYRMLFKAVGYAYDSHQIEALTCFTRAQQMAELQGYPRGVIRALMGTGMTHKEISNSREAINAFNKAMLIANEHGFMRAENRLQSLLNGPLKVKAIDTAIENQLLQYSQEIISLISENDLLYARQKLVFAEAFRRKHNILRKSYSFYLWSAVIKGLQGQMQSCSRILNRLDDQVLKLQVLSLLKEKQIPLNSIELNQIKIIETQFLPLSNVQQVDLNEIKNINVRALLLVLSTSKKPLAKEELFQKVFNITYDPIIHDSKLYKIIMLARKEVGADFIINHHGTYSCNTKKYQIVG